MTEEQDIVWPLWKRVGFRFAFVYFVLYTLPFPLDYLPFAGDWFEERWVMLWRALVPRMVEPFLGAPIPRAGNGSSDTSWGWFQIVCYIAIAAIVALLWSVLDRRRPHYARLYRYLHTYLRFSLAGAMFSYGIQKIIPAQFPPPSLDRLVSTYGSSSPMGFLWTFMGASTIYEIYAGGAELLAGILLVVPRTVLLGELVTIGVMSNVVATNLGFDVSVKTYAMHLFVIAIFLAAPDVRRIIDVFFRQPARPLFENRRARILWLVVAALLVTRFVYVNLRDTIPFYLDRISLAHRSPLRGVWDVDLLDVDGVARPPLVTDATRWRRVVFDFQGQGSIFLMNDDRNLYRITLDETKKTIGFTNRFQPNGVFHLTYVRPNAQTLQLDGVVGGHRIHAVCKLDDRKYLLTSRGFHWVNERALNR